LHAADLRLLERVRRDSNVAPPDGLIPWFCGSQPLGHIRAPIASALCAALDDCRAHGNTVVWDALHLTGKARSERLQSALRALHAQDMVSGWRNELFAFWSDDCEAPRLDIAPLFAVERAGFRPLGMRSHAVHINGFTPNGQLWCARRSPTKATDPGKLDNLTAGGVPAGEALLECAKRELWEEAGLRGEDLASLVSAGWVDTRRLEPQGWHDEVLHVYNLTLGRHSQPANQDGEVAEFMCLDAAQTMRRIEAGEFTVDAVASLAQSLACGAAGTA